MENDETQRAILAELGTIRRTLKTILYVLASGLLLLALAVIQPGLAVAVAIVAGVVALIVLLAAGVGIILAKVANGLNRN